MTATLIASDIPELTDEELLAATPEELTEYEALLEVLGDEWIYTERQAKASEMAGLSRETLYGGAAGGGKSDWLVHYFYDMALAYPGFEGLLLRMSFPELWRSLIARSLQRFDRSVARYVAGRHIWMFDNGSTIEFGHLEKRIDVYKYDSAEYDAIGWDELTQWADDFSYRYLFSRNRTNAKKRRIGLRPHIVAGTTPGRSGNLWVRERFVDPGPSEEVHEVVLDDPEIPAELRKTTRAFVPAKHSDNPYNDPSYHLTLSNLDAATRKAYRDGSWDVIEGQYFSEWDRDLHVIAPFPIPEWWTRLRAYDYGYAAPACCLWLAFDGDGTAYAYREFYESGLTPPEQARIIDTRSVRPLDERGASTTPERLDLTICDPSIWTETGVGPSIARQMQDGGLRGLRKANNARVAGWLRLREFLRPDPTTGQPKLYVFDTCRNLIRTLPMLPRDENNPEDLDTKSEDHAADALRYGLMSRPAPSHAPKEPERRLNDSERMAARIRDGRPKRVHDHPELGRI